MPAQVLVEDDVAGPFGLLLLARRSDPDEQRSARHPAPSLPVGIGSPWIEAKRINTVRIQTSEELVEMPWQTAKQLRGRLLAADLYPLEDYFAAKGTSAPVVLEQADKEPLLVVVGAWVDEVGQEPAVALGGLLSLRDALRADLADPPPAARNGT